MNRITIFTPTYNRAYLLPRLYESLCRQTNMQYTWMVVDDGSTDHTEQLVKAWQKENKVNITYHYQTNAGKHAAMEWSHAHCDTDYILCIDSDDSLAENAIAILYSYLPDIDKDTSIAGIVGRCCTMDMVPLSTLWPTDNEALYFHELNDKYGYNRDTLLVFKTAIVRQYHFPIFPDERFVPEKVFYNMFMYQYRLLPIAELLYVCEYVEDGYTAMGMSLFERNPKGKLCSLRQDVYYMILQRKGTCYERIKAAASCIMWKKWYHISYKEDVYRTLYKWPAFYTIISQPLACIMYRRHKRKTNNKTC